MKAFERNNLEARRLYPTEASSNYTLEFLTKKLHSNFGFQKFLLSTVFIQHSSTF